MNIFQAANFAAHWHAEQATKRARASERSARRAMCPQVHVTKAQHHRETADLFKRIANA